MKFEFLLIDRKFNIPFSFSLIEKQFVIISYVGLKLGALDGNIPLVIYDSNISYDLTFYPIGLFF